MSIRYEEDKSIGYIVFDQPDSKVNVLNAATLKALDNILDEVAKKPLKALIFKSAKKDIFIAGADIKEIEHITEVEDGKKKAQAGQFIFNKIEDLPYPTVAVINGAALGGGCELALACRYRIGIFGDSVKIGLPEVNLGFIPGFGGTYRLPKVVGLMQALKMITSGGSLSAANALKIGLIDKLFPLASLDADLTRFITQIIEYPNGRILPYLKAKGFDRFLCENPFGQKVLFDQTKKAVLNATKGFYPAPMKAVETIRRHLYLSRQDALDVESTQFAQLAITPISKSLVHVFYLAERYKKLTLPQLEGVPYQDINYCTVLGAGIMGGGIAQLLSNRGVWVRLKDINWDAVAKGMKAAYDVYASQVKRKRMKPHELIAKMAYISTTVDHEGVSSSQMIIEAVVEKMEIKKSVLQDVANRVSADAIIASNTSSLSVSEMATVIPNPSRVLGFHFFNPVHRMPLIEIITTDKTSPTALSTALNFAKKLGKTPIVVKDAPGFLVNRILLGYINEAGHILQEGGAIEPIDNLITRFGMPMGPFTLADEVGLDVGVKVLHILHDGLGDRFKPVEIFDKILAQQMYGKKNGKGFYIHGPKERRVNMKVSSMVTGRHWVGEEDALKRMLYIMINEAAMILEEGVVDSAATVDVGMIMGTGFPPFRGGLLKYADSVGVENILKDLEALSSKSGFERFKPSAYLIRLAKAGKKFYDV